MISKLFIRTHTYSITCDSTIKREDNPSVLKSFVIGDVSITPTFVRTMPNGNGLYSLENGATFENEWHTELLLINYKNIDAFLEGIKKRAE